MMQWTRPHSPLCLFIGASSTDIVIQTPDASVTEGDTLNITCCFTSMSERMRFTWKKNQTQISVSIVNNLSTGSQMNHSCSTLTFSNITGEDSGKYICYVDVEIPLYFKKEGNGTVITVVPRGNIDGNTDQHTFGGRWANTTGLTCTMQMTHTSITVWSVTGCARICFRRKKGSNCFWPQRGKNKTQGSL